MYIHLFLEILRFFVLKTELIFCVKSNHVSFLINRRQLNGIKYHEISYNKNRSLLMNEGKSMLIFFINLQLIVISIIFIFL